MMCSLLALATGLALGSQIAPGASGMTPAPSLLPELGQRMKTWLQPAATEAPPPASPLNAMVDADATIDPTLEGGRQPRMPRMSREASARPMR